MKTVYCIKPVDENGNGQIIKVLEDDLNKTEYENCIVFEMREGC